MRVILSSFSSSYGDVTPTVVPSIVTNKSGFCETGWTLKNERCYKLITERLTWSDAQNKCLSMNSSLVEVANSREQDALNDFLNSREPPPGSAWIGLRTKLTVGLWTWGSGRPMNYSKWDDSEPNNVGGVEHCVNVWPSLSSKWNDYTCNTTLQGVCQKEICGTGWTLKNEWCYKLTVEKLTWSDAQDECRSMRSHLVEVTNAREQDALNDFINSREPIPWSAWIGLNNLLTDGSWTWSSGLPMNYSKWFESEPNNLGGSEHCVNVWPNQSSKWNDYTCNTTFQGVCQKGSCEPGWAMKKEWCYKLTAEELAWRDAQSQCLSISSLLVEVTNSREQDDLNDFLNSLKPPPYSAWIGLSNQQLTEGPWTWGSGRPMNYSKWFDSASNNRGGAERCVHVWPSESSKWNDYPCNRMLQGVCQKDPSSTPALLSNGTTFDQPSFRNSVETTTLAIGTAFTTTNALGCAVSSELCRTLSQRGLCTNQLFKDYMDLHCRRSCGSCA